MDDRERDRSIGEFEQALEDGSVVNATSEQLQRWVVALCLDPIANERVRPRRIIEGITLNNIQMAQTIRRLEETIERLDAGNQRTQKLVVFLARVAVVVGILQVMAALCALAAY